MPGAHAIGGTSRVILGVARHFDLSSSIKFSSYGNGRSGYHRLIATHLSSELTGSTEILHRICIRYLRLIDSMTAGGTREHNSGHQSTKREPHV
jgi:hypothetical protein